MDKQEQQKVIPFLKTLLADESALYINTVGINFYPLDLTCISQLHKIDQGMDRIAEHMRQYRVSNTLEFTDKTHLNVVPRLSSDARTRVLNLIAEHLSIIRLLQENINKIDGESNDITAVDLMISLLQQHQKMVQVLRLSLGN